MENRKRPAGETAAIILSVIAVAALVIGGIVAAVILVVGTVLNVQTKLGLWAEDYKEYIYSGSDSYVSGSDFTVDSSVNKINIDWIAGDITVKTVEGGSFRVYESSESDDPEDVMRHKTDGSSLKIKFRASGVYQSEHKKDLTVEIPASSEIKSVIINTVSSDITFEGGSFGDISVNTVSGGVALSNIACRELDIDGVSCDVSADFAVQPRDVDIKAVSGEVELKLPQEPEDVELESASGAIRVNGAQTRLKYESDSRAGEGDIEVDTVSGDITLETKS